MICWGAWGSTTKMTGKWRFELFYIDFVIGLLLCAVACSLTLGMFASDITFYDNLTIVRKLQMGFAGLSGLVFALAGILFLGTISITGMSIAFSLSFGVAIAVNVIWNSIEKPGASPVLVFAGAVVAAAAAGLAVLAYLLAHAHSRSLQPAPLPGKRIAPFPPAAIGISVGAAAGLLFGALFPLLNRAKQGEIEMGPHAVGFVFAIGVILSSPVLVLYFLNLPLRGPAISITAYFSGTASQHLLGILGGVVWYAGTISFLVAQTATDKAIVDPKLIQALGQCGAVLATLSGLLLWKDLAKFPSKATLHVFISVLLTLAAILLIYLS